MNFTSFFNIPSNRFLDRLMAISIPERSEKPVILGSHANWSYPQKVFLCFDQLKVKIKKYLKIWKMRVAGDLSIPHNISSHCPKNRFRAFHPINAEHYGELGILTTTWKRSDSHSKYLMPIAWTKRIASCQHKCLGPPHSELALCKHPV